MFDTIAPRYDLINRLMTFGLDQAWRRGTVAALALPEGSLVLDLACGTGDLSRLALRRGYRVVGTDLSAGMLGANGAATPLVEADGSRLPFVDGAFDGLVCGYALRNFTDLAATLAESARVLRPGGRLAVLEVDTPTAPLWRAGYDLWFTKAVPALGAALSDREAYRYLPQSVAYLPPTPVLRAMLRRGRLLRRGDPAPGRRPQPDGGGHPHRRPVTARDTAAPTPPRRTPPAAALHARTVPLEYGPDALEFDGSPTVLFDRPGLTLVGWGTALLVPATEAAAALAAIPCDDEVRTLGSGPVALGALPFTDTFAGHLVVPRFTMGTSRDADGVTRRWATAVGPADVALPDTDELFDAVIWQYGTTPTAADTAAEAGVVDLTTAMTAEGYAAMVADAVAAMAEPGADPAQGRAVAAGRGAPARTALPVGRPAPAAGRRAQLHHLLHARARGLLLRRQPRAPGGPARRPGVEPPPGRAPCRGATPPGPTPTPSAAWPGRPRTGPSTATSSTTSPPPWQPFCDELSVPPEPSVVAFRSVAHLGTRIEGRLLGDPARRGARAPATGSIPRRPSAARPAPTPSPSSPPTRRASAATGPDRSAGSAPTATGSG